MAVKEQDAGRSIVNSVVSPAADYEVDFFEWTQSTAELIRQGRLAEVDLEHLAEEIESMGKRDRREVQSRLIVLLTHLLKWEFQPEMRKTSWRSTIREQRKQVRLVVGDSPSLGRLPREDLPALFRSAVEDAIEETGLDANHFPSSCPYTPDQVLDSDFLP